MAASISKFPQWYKLRPIQELNENDLELLYQQSEFKVLQPRTLIMAEAQQLVYLLEGEVSLLSGGFVTEKFTHLQQRALSPLFDESLEEDSAVLTSHGSIVIVDRELFEGLFKQSHPTVEWMSENGLNLAQHELFKQLRLAFKHRKLELPALPEAALKIRQVINNAEVGSTEIIQIVQSDPVLSARLVMVANSPLYGTWREIKTVRDAVRRLGLETTKNLAFGMSVKQLFSAKTQLIKNLVQDLYHESIGIAAIAFVITQYRADSLNAEQALLCGLVQNLGLLPILKYIDEHPSMMQTPEMLGETTDKLKLQVTAMLFDEWHFDPIFIDVVEQSENWQRDSGETIDYCDVLIAARLLYRQQQDRLPVDSLHGLPVIEKLQLFEFDDDGQFFMDKAEQEIEDMQQLLQAG